MADRDATDKPSTTSASNDPDGLRHRKRDTGAGATAATAASPPGAGAGAGQESEEELRKMLEENRASIQKYLENKNSMSMSLKLDLLFYGVMFLVLYFVIYYYKPISLPSTL